ncbi:MAG: alpha/beta hydrolase [Sterolibacterium sp.]
MTTWVLLRGLTRESRHWGAFVDTFRAALGGAEVVALDLPGNGCLNGMRSFTKVADMVDWCRLELSARGVPPPYHLLGMSLGAMVAVEWAYAHADEVRGGVLINTSLGQFSPFYRRLRPANYPALLGLSLLGGSDEEWETTILRITSRRAIDTAKVRSSWIAWRHERPVGRSNALRQLLAAWRYRAPAGRPTVPILVLASAQDALVDPRCSMEIATRWSATYVEHPTAGHDLPLDDGAWVAKQVGAWLDSIHA